MCNAKPGLRCATHANQKVKAIEKQLRRTALSLPSTKKNERIIALAQKLKEAQFEYNLTDKGQEELYAKGENTKALRNISRNRRLAFQDLKALTDQMANKTGNISFDLKLQEIETTLENLKSSSKELDHSLFNSLNSSENSEYKVFENRIHKKAEIDAKIALYERQLSDKKELTAQIEERLKLSHNELEPFLEKHKMSKEDFVNQSLKVGAIISSKKYNLASLTEQDFDVVPGGAHNPIVKAMVANDAGSIILDHRQQIDNGEERHSLGFDVSSQKYARRILHYIEKQQHKGSITWTESIKKFDDARTYAGI